LDAPSAGASVARTFEIRHVSLPGYFIALGAVVIGAIAQRSVGFGFGMLAAPVLALIDEVLVPGPCGCSVWPSLRW
jgi:hypothetical protein